MSNKRTPMGGWEDYRNPLQMAYVKEKAEVKTDREAERIKKNEIAAKKAAEKAAKLADEVARGDNSSMRNGDYRSAGEVRTSLAKRSARAPSGLNEGAPSGGIERIVSDLKRRDHELENSLEEARAHYYRMKKYYLRYEGNGNVKRADVFYGGYKRELERIRDLEAKLASVRRELPSVRRKLAPRRRELDSLRRVYIEIIEDSKKKIRDMKYELDREGRKFDCLKKEHRKTSKRVDEMEAKPIWKKVLASLKRSTELKSEREKLSYLKRARSDSRNKILNLESRINKEKVEFYRLQEDLGTTLKSIRGKEDAIATKIHTETTKKNEMAAEIAAKKADEVARDDNRTMGKGYNNMESSEGLSNGTRTQSAGSYVKARPKVEFQTEKLGQVDHLPPSLRRVRGTVRGPGRGPVNGVKEGLQFGH